MPDTEFPTLYAVDRRGTVQSWRIYTRGDLVIVEHGKLGKKQAVHRDRAIGTNTGRANARNAEQQAAFEAEAAWVKKLKTGYFRSIDEARTRFVFLPMLAHPLSETNRGHTTERDVLYPVDAQPKLNGVRALSAWVDHRIDYQRDIGAHDTICCRSRVAEEWPAIPHIREELRELLRPGDMVDGELYVHGIPLQTINSWAQALTKDSLLLQYHLYDMPAVNGSVNGSWEERRHELETRYAAYMTKRGRLGSAIHLVPSTRVNSRAEVDAFGQAAVANGYEGLILRAISDQYSFNDRTSSLLKWKQFYDEEFRVIGGHPREWFDASGTPRVILDKFVCQNTYSDHTFEVVPRGDVAQREEYWRNLQAYVGRDLTVRFYDRSIDGVPQGNPVGIGFRLQIDLSTFASDDMGWIGT